MGHSRILSMAAGPAVLVLPAGASCADKADGAGSAETTRVLVLVGKHGFPEKPFYKVFDRFSDMKCTFVAEKVGGEAFGNIDNWAYDVIVLYNHNQNLGKTAGEILETHGSLDRTGCIAPRPARISQVARIPEDCLHSLLRF
jgi:hypothetical protein